jgi:hypothetical protein
MTVTFLNRDSELLTLSARGPIGQPFREPRCRKGSERRSVPQHPHLRRHARPAIPFFPRERDLLGNVREPAAA